MGTRRESSVFKKKEGRAALPTEEKQDSPKISPRNSGDCAWRNHTPPRRKKRSPFERKERSTISRIKLGPRISNCREKVLISIFEGEDNFSNVITEHLYLPCVNGGGKEACEWEEASGFGSEHTRFRWGSGVGCGGRVLNSGKKGNTLHYLNGGEGGGENASLRRGGKGAGEKKKGLKRRHRTGGKG